MFAGLAFRGSLAFFPPFFFSAGPMMEQRRPAFASSEVSVLKSSSSLVATSVVRGGSTRKKEEKSGPTSGERTSFGDGGSDVSSVQPPALEPIWPGRADSLCDGNVLEASRSPGEPPVSGNVARHSCEKKEELCLPTDVSAAEDAEQRAAQACAERLRLAQNAEEAVLRRLHLCVVSLLSLRNGALPRARAAGNCASLPRVLLGDNGKGLTQCTQDTDTSVFTEYKDNVLSSCDGCGDGSSSATSSKSCTRKVWLPISSASCDNEGGDAPSSVQPQLFDVPDAGLTNSAKRMYDILWDLLSNHATSPLLYSGEDEADEAASHQETASAPVFPQSSPTMPRADQGQEPLTESNARVNGTRNCYYEEKGSAVEQFSEARTPEALRCVSPQLPQNALLFDVSSPLHATRASTPSDTEGDAVFFPTPPRRAGIHNEAASLASVATRLRRAPHMEHVECDEAGDGHATRSSRGGAVPSALLTTKSSVLDSAPRTDIRPPGGTLTQFTTPFFDSASSQATVPQQQPLMSQTHTFGSVSMTAAAASLPRAELTATDILATITALPPPPSRSLTTRGRKKLSKCCSLDDSAYGASQHSERVRHGVGKRSRTSEFVERHNSELVERACVHGAPLMGLPCLGVDVGAAAAASLAYRSQQLVRRGSSYAHLSASASFQKEHAGVQAVAASSSSASSPPARGYVRTRQQRADDVARTEAIFEAVRRAGGGGIGAPPLSPMARQQEALAVPSDDASQLSSHDSLQHTPSQYWEIDFP